MVAVAVPIDHRRRVRLHIDWCYANVGRSHILLGGHHTNTRDQLTPSEDSDDEEEDEGLIFILR